MPVLLNNSHLSVEIDPLGAQLLSVKGAGGTEYLWQGDPAVWARRAPLLFPVIGRLLNGQYTLGEKVYSIPTHGFARDSLFTVEGQGEDSVSFRLTHSPETLAVYPFPFSLTVSYTLEENRLAKACRVENLSQETMYYELGGHDGFRAPLGPGEVMDDYAILIPGLEAITPYGMNQALLITPKGGSHPLPGGRIPLKPWAFGLDTIILDDLPCRRAILADGAGRPRVVLDFPHFPYLGLWTQRMPFDANYICIEPWTALPDAVFAGRGLAEKTGVRTLAPGAAETLAYTTTFD